MTVRSGFRDDRSIDAAVAAVFVACETGGNATLRRRSHVVPTKTNKNVVTLIFY